MMNLEDQVIAELEKRDIPYTRRNGEINCRCLTGTHEDRHPSMWINLDKNVYYCFSCQAKGKASDLLDLEIDEETLRFIQYKKFLQELEQSTKVIDEPVGYPDQLLPPTSHIELPNEWRGIHKDLLEALGVYYCTQGRYRGRLIFPSFNPLTKEINGFDARIFDEYNQQYNIEVFAPDAKYLRPRAVKTLDVVWVPKTLLDSSVDTVVLTEGVVDAVSLLEMGHPAIANYGLLSFTPERAALLYAMGVQNVTMGLDLDKPAFNALPRISESIKQQGFRVTKPLLFVKDMLKLGIKDYNDYLIYRRTNDGQRMA